MVWQATTGGNPAQLTAQSGRDGGYGGENAEEGRRLEKGRRGAKPCAGSRVYDRGRVRVLIGTVEKFCMLYVCF